MLPPERIDGAQVVAYAVLDHECRSTGRCVHRHGEKRLGPFAALAIATYDGEGCYYLLYCDQNWTCVADTYHDSVEGTMRQAESEYKGVAGKWTKPPW